MRFRNLGREILADEKALEAANKGAERLVGKTAAPFQYGGKPVTEAEYRERIRDAARSLQNDTESRMLAAHRMARLLAKMDDADLYERANRAFTTSEERESFLSGYAQERVRLQAVRVMDSEIERRAKT